jgi:hypothetical protein
VIPAQRADAGRPGHSAIDGLMRLVWEDAESHLRSLGEWLRAYQRVTHYLRALNVWEPPPHLLARTVLERAVRRAAGDGPSRVPLWLAMEEMHALLGEQDGASQDARDARAILQDSACWRTGAWLMDGGKHIAVEHAAGAARLLIERPVALAPVPIAAPSPMVPQPLDLYPLRRLLRALTDKVLRLRFGLPWKRRHA